MSIFQSINLATRSSYFDNTRHRVIRDEAPGAVSGQSVLPAGSILTIQSLPSSRKEPATSGKTASSEVHPGTFH